ncbi:MAG: phosphoribosylformylglycinamidine synthase subunit PurL [Bacteroidia bacterium]|nr:phosphoribosylformylglycinamidine synthase subunit PurL [Bacteroidia bacterium]MDW8235431.1 phosphoribosylformylglycinamidine synthase subunit PurL [Bacteroidia bacterium]
MGSVSASRAVADRAGIAPNEYERIVSLLNREPTEVEVWLFSALWSEHCSYKSSLLHLKKLPRSGLRTLRSAGEENAGLLEIGGGWALAFKVESHNHPSAVAPYQGAATGVGGIHRDIMAVGARPIAALNSLHFGYPIDPQTYKVIEGVVRGIGDYGNAFGVPTIGGETYFAPEYTGKPIVNALSVGIVRKEKIVSARARGIGNRVLYLGAPTGPDGIGGAAFASEELSGDTQANLPAIQVGDPFREKLLMEALTEMVEADLLVAMQDMGAAGLASSTAETAARGKVGMRILLDKVPSRGGIAQPHEFLLSESQERMLLVAEPQKVPILQAIAHKWDILCVEIGEITDTGLLEYWWKGERVACLPPSLLMAGEGAPVYDWECQPPTYLQEVASFSIEQVEDIIIPQQFREVVAWLVQHPNLCSRRWIYQQYDRMVGACTIGSAGEMQYAAPLLRLPYEDRAIAVTLDANPWWVEAEPRQGTALCVAEAARQVACTGAVPLGVTNCLNFGSPQQPEVYWQFVEAIEGLKIACEALELPVTGGNVSFYNQDGSGAVLPTPVIGVVGLLENALYAKVPMGLPDTEAFLYLIGAREAILQPTLGSSHYLRDRKGVRYSPAPRLSLEAEKALIQLLPKLAQQGFLLAAQDVSDGGLLLALLEMAWIGGNGFSVSMPAGVRIDAFWLGEDGARVVVAISPQHVPLLEEKTQEVGLYSFCLGRVIPKWGIGEINLHTERIILDLVALKGLWESALERALPL